MSIFPRTQARRTVRRSCNVIMSVAAARATRRAALTAELPTVATTATRQSVSLACPACTRLRAERRQASPPHTVSKARNLRLESDAAWARLYSTASSAPKTDAPAPRVIHTVKELREWRKRAMRDGKLVGFVPTMGALHAGHLSLVQASLENNDYTVVSIFVNPAQFAPHEDLAAYPRTLPADSAALAQLSSGEKRVDIIFAPAVSEMYPSGLTQVVADQVGAFVEVKGLSHQMEGGSRPTFFRGVATVCTKLFHAVQPDNTYFGQKDIQQSVILRRMLSDLLFPFPEAQNMHVMPTTRDAETGLALSSRNAYLSAKTRREHAPALYKALKAGQRAWDEHAGADGATRIARTLAAARQVVHAEARRAAADGVTLKLDYISLNDPESLADLEKSAQPPQRVDRAIMSGAVLASERGSDGSEGRVTRLIDNVLLGFTM